MTVAIKTSVKQLDQSIRNLETAIQLKSEENQQDLFTTVDTKALASRLDSAINKVEEILKEG